jgi:hypothetical protein
LSKANDDPADHRVIAGTISNGNIVGDYSGATFTWEATGAGEWAEETDLLSETTLGFTVADPGGLKDFVSVPISETYATVLYIPQPGSTVNFTTATMDLHFYNNGTDRIWTGVADGTFTGSVPNNWTLNLSDGTNSLEMHGDQWNNGQWHATVVNGMAPAQPPDATFSGDAGGTYKDNGTFKGVAAGKWQSVT